MGSGDELLDCEDFDLSVVTRIAVPELAVSFGEGHDPLLGFRRQMQALLDGLSQQLIELMSELVFRCSGVAPSLARYAFNASSIAWHSKK
jgi:hypothetical protein